MWQKQTTAFRYTIYGALFGLIFPVLATFLDLVGQHLPLTLQNLAQVHASSPLHWAIDTAPFFLGLLAGLAGRNQDKLIRLNETLIQRDQERDSAIQQHRTFQNRMEQHIADRTHDLERRSAYMTATADIGRAAASILEIDRLMRTLVDLIRERFDLYYVGLFMVDENREWAVLQAGTGEAGRTMLARSHRIRIGEGMIGWSIANDQARVALQAEIDAVRLTIDELPNTRSEAALPLRSRGRVLGALSVQDERPSAFDQDILTVLQTMADQVAVALDNARLFAESQATVEAVQRAYGQLSRQAWSELVRARPNLGFRRDRRGISPARGPVNFDQPSEESGALSTDQNNAALRFSLTVALRGQVLGLIDAKKAPESGQWAPEEMQLLETIAERLGTVLEDARLYEETQRRARREQLVRQITDRVRSAPDVDSIMRIAVQEIRRALGVSHGAVRIGTETHLSPPGNQIATGNLELQSQYAEGSEGELGDE